MDLAIVGEGFVHHHDAAVGLDGDRRQRGSLAYRGNDELVRMNQVGALKRLEVNPVDSLGILLADQRVDMLTGTIRGDGGDVAAQVVDTMASEV